MTRKGECSGCGNFGTLKLVDGEYLCSECILDKYPNTISKKDEATLNGD